LTTVRHAIGRRIMRLRRFKSTMAAALFAASVPLVTQSAIAADVTEYVTPPDADAYIDKQNKSDNFGAVSDLKVRTTSTGPVSWQRTVLRFDLTDFATELPAGATINAVALKLWMTATPSAVRTYDLYACSDETWDELTIDYQDHKYTCTDAENLGTLLASSTTPGSSGFSAQAMSWSSTALKDDIIQEITTGDGVISLLVKDNSESPSPPPAQGYSGNFHSKEGTLNTYPTDDFQPVLAITYHVDDTPSACEYPIQIVEFSATPGIIVPDESSTFHVKLTIQACEDLISIKSQGGSAGNTTTSNVECTVGDCSGAKPTGRGNQVTTWNIPTLNASDDPATLEFDVTTGKNFAGKNICGGDPGGDILKNVTGAWSVTGFYDNSGTLARHTVTHGELVVDISCD